MGPPPADQGEQTSCIACGGRRLRLSCFALVGDRDQIVTPPVARHPASPLLYEPGAPRCARQS
jgi:hypothetical protein